MIDIRVLGPVELREESLTVPLGPPMQRTVFAALVLNLSRPVSPETLIERLWDGSPPQQARTSLYSHVARLRHALAFHAVAEILITRDASGYALSADPGVVDVFRSRGLVDRARVDVAHGRVDTGARLYREAIRLWRGEPLCGLRGGWVERTRALLRQEHISALIGYFAAELCQERHAEVLDELSAAVYDNPLDETLAGQLMVCLDRAQRHAEALEVFDRLQTGLAEHLNVRPGRSLELLRARLACPA